jgi:hypothetical protein
MGRFVCMDNGAVVMGMSLTKRSMVMGIAPVGAELDDRGFFGGLPLRRFTAIFGAWMTGFFLGRPLFRFTGGV